MCGRYMLRADPHQLGRAFRLDELSQIPRDLPLRFNIAPSQAVPIVRELRIVRQAGDGASRELATVRWGLIPAWGEEPSIRNKMVHPRAGGAAENAAVPTPLPSRPLNVPGCGFLGVQRRR